MALENPSAGSAGGTSDERLHDLRPRLAEAWPFYAEDEIEAVAVYCGDLNRCYYLPITMVSGKSYVHLRLSPARNNQRMGVTMAAEYEFGAIAQLGERLAGSQKVAGSSPASSTPTRSPDGGLVPLQGSDAASAGPAYATSRRGASPQSCSIR